MHTYVIRGQSVSECVEGHRGLRGSHARNRGLKLFARTIPPRVTDHMLRAAPVHTSGTSARTHVYHQSLFFLHLLSQLSTIVIFPYRQFFFYSIPSAVAEVFLFIRDSTDESVFSEISCAEMTFSFCLILSFLNQKRRQKLKVSVVVKDRVGRNIEFRKK